MDGWDRQDGYRRQLAITVSPVALSGYGGVDGSTVSFSSFLQPLMRPPFAVLPADRNVLVPMFAVSESESLLPLTDPTSTPTSGVATRLELARHADATFESVTGKTKAEVLLPTAAQQHQHTATAGDAQLAAQLDQPDVGQRKRRRDPSPAPAVAPHDIDDKVTEDKRRAKQSKVTDAVALVHSMSLSPIDELTPRNGRQESTGKHFKPAKSSSALRTRPRGQSRERSASRARAFEREHNPPVSHLHMPEHSERAWSARKRRLQQQQVDDDIDDEDDDTDTLEQLVYPSAFTLLRRQRRRFITRMTCERNRMHGQSTQSLRPLRAVLARLLTCC